MMDDFAAELLSILQRMDDESDEVAVGFRTGLINYMGKGTEASWRDGIARHLNAGGVTADVEVHYPGEAKRCDIVATRPDGKRVWIELKPAWRAWRRVGGGVEFNDTQIYRSYLYGPLEPRLEKTHSAAQDFDKLERLTVEHADYVALLLVGLDEANGELDADVTRLIEMKGLADAGWRVVGPTVWPDRNTDACEHRCWVMWREPTEVSTVNMKSDGESLSHLDEQGRTRMVHVGDKTPTARRAIAEAKVRISAELAAAIEANALAKGNLLEVARLAGIAAAKRTDELIPLCHSLPLEHVDVRATLRDGCVYIRTEASTTGKTGVEMEAYTAAAVAALTVIDMGKAIDPAMVIDNIRLIEKTGGRRGTLTPHASEYPS